MRKFLLLFVLTLALISCKVNEKPEFIQVNSLKVIDATPSNFTIQADLKFENKNSVGGTLQAKDIHVFIDSIDVALINSKEFDVPKKSEFVIPLEATIPFSKVYKDNKQSILDNIMHIISTKKIVANYNGEIRYKLGAFHYDYPLDYKQELVIKK